MSISTTINRWSYVGNGVTTAFAYTNKILASTDLKVYLETIADGTLTLQTETTHYTVSGAGEAAGGNVTFVTAPSSAYNVVIVREVPYTQPAEFDPRKQQSPSGTEDAFDRATILVQQVLDRLSRTIGLATGKSSPASLDGLTGDLANSYLAFDSNEQPYAAAGPVAGATVSVAMVPVVEAASPAAALNLQLAAFGASDKTAARQLLGALGTERVANTAVLTVANSHKGKLIACSSGPYDLDFAAIAGYDADFAIFIEVTGTRAVRLDFSDGGTDQWVYPGQTIFVAKSGTAWTIIRPPRWRPTSDITFYVDAANGSDSNDGLASGSGNAFQTKQKAVDVIAGELICDPAYNVTVQLSGNSTDAVTLKPPVGTTALGYIRIFGHATPSNVVVTVASNNAYSYSQPGLPWSIEGQRVLCTTSGVPLAASQGAHIKFSNIEFGATPSATAHIQASTNAIIEAIGNYSIIAGFSTHAATFYGGTIITTGRTVTLSGTPAIANEYCYIESGWFYCGGMTFSGSATGKRYTAVMAGVIHTNGGGASYLPGNSSGSSTGATYV